MGKVVKDHNVLIETYKTEGISPATEKARRVVMSLLDYIIVLEDYCKELDEKWDETREREYKKLIELMRKAREEQETKNKRVQREKPTKPPYRV